MILHKEYFIEVIEVTTRSVLIFQSFDYTFKVYPVVKCPMNKEAWNLSSIRMNCNKTHGYHCVPNKGLTSLIEFCYPRGESILFQEGKVNYV